MGENWTTVEFKIARGQVHEIVDKLAKLQKSDCRRVKVTSVMSGKE